MTRTVLEPTVQGHPTFVVLRNEAGAWFWHEVASNGQISSTSGESFSWRWTAKRAARKHWLRTTPGAGLVIES